MHYTEPPLARVSFFMAAALPEISTLSLHDALPISDFGVTVFDSSGQQVSEGPLNYAVGRQRFDVPEGLRSEEHTSELQSHHELVCRLLLEKKNKGEPQNAGAILLDDAERVDRLVLR